MKTFFILIFSLLLAGVSVNIQAQSAGSVVPVKSSAKQEFRGAWIQTAFQDRYSRLTSHECKAYLEELVTDLQRAGFNAILFQVRPEGDAFYRSDIEPWSRFLTGRQGRAPHPVWDPMEYLIKLCHDRQMEFHAWINPYRMSASRTLKMDNQHLYYKHSEWFVRYQDKYYLNPGLPESRAYIRDVVKDIVSRYDIDAIHMDDYFYPYPTAGVPFDDRTSFQTYAPIMGFDLDDPAALGNYRRRSVDILIKYVRQDIRDLKPWVRFGISPFGIYRNQKSAKGGSRTNGTQCYDDLYADVLKWCQEGWIDYVIPQIYWEVGHQLADYETLTEWWADNVPEHCHLYIGQSIERSLDEPKDSKPKPDLRHSHAHFAKKLNQARADRRIDGMCFWYAYQVQDNAYHVRDFLQTSVFTRPALLPAYTALDDKAPAKVRRLKAEFTGRGLHLSWEAPDTDDPAQQPAYYCVYKFAKGERVNIKNTDHLFMLTESTQFYDYDVSGSSRFTYVVTAVDACNNEGKGAKKKIRIRIK